MVEPAPPKNAVERSSVALAPCGNHWPNAPHPLGKSCGALAKPDNGLPGQQRQQRADAKTDSAEQRAKAQHRKPGGKCAEGQPPATPQKLASIEPRT
jgi:hypothetical protein